MRAETGPIGGKDSHEFHILGRLVKAASSLISDFYDMDWKNFEIDYDNVEKVAKRCF